MQVHAGVLADRLKEVLEHAGLDATRHGGREIHVPHKAYAVAKVNTHTAQSLVHRHKVKAVAFNALLVTEAFHEGLAKHNGNVFHAMVHIHVDIALASQIQVNATVNLEQIKHMVQEAVTGINLARSTIIQV
jgi:hypothetical protein